MAIVYPNPSRTFSEYLLIPNLTGKDCIPSNVDLRSPLVKFKRGEEPELTVNLPLVSAIMQSVSDHNMAIALARSGGISFIYQSQVIEKQAEMVRKVKKYKAGFVPGDCNLSPEGTLRDVINLKEKTGHSTVAITHDGSSNGRLLGIVTSRDYRPSRADLTMKVEEFMTPFEDIIYAEEGISLKEANDILWDNKLNCLPIIDKEGCLSSFVFRKDYDSHKENPFEMLDKHKRLVCGAGINTRDYKERVPALIEAGADVLCIDSSDGFSEWQADTICWIRKQYGDTVKVGAGNVVDTEGFNYLANAGADFIKVGIGGGSICITREQKGIGRGQATSVMDVAEARDRYFNETGTYIPICSDGGIVHDYHMVLALAMGADFIMLGRYFARFDESPTRRLKIGNNIVKEYWGEGSNRARNWARYSFGGDDKKMEFEEGVDSYVPYAGSLKENLQSTIAKIKATMCSCGQTTLKDLRERARVTLISSTGIIEGGAHDVMLKDNEMI